MATLVSAPEQIRTAVCALDLLGDGARSKQDEEALLCSETIDLMRLGKLGGKAKTALSSSWESASTLH